MTLRADSEHTDSLQHAGLDPSLDADITLLSDMLGEAVRELAGERGQTLMHDIREAALALRAGVLPGGRDAFAARIGSLELDDLALVARMFTLWFHLVNAAEQQHRIRILRQRDTAGSAPEESLADGVARLRAAGFTAQDVIALLGRMFIMPVLTAHPTEARRRTILEHLSVVAQGLDTLDRTQLGAREQQHVLTNLRNAVTSLFATEESRAVKPTPRDEIATALDVFDTTLLTVTPQVYRAFEEALAANYPEEQIELPPFLRWGTWIGGDRDGNPYITAEITRYVLEQQRLLVLGQYLKDVEELMRELSISAHRASSPAGLAELEASLALDRERLPEVAARAQRYTTREPWREKLWYVRARLLATKGRDDAAYSNVESFLEELELLQRTLIACGFERLANSYLRDVIRRVEVFGFHLATLDLRQHSGVHERAVADILRATGVTGTKSYLDMNEEERVALLVETLERADFQPPTTLSQLVPEARELLATLEMVGRARREQGAAVCERYIVSFTASPSDLLEVLFLVRAARLSPGELRPVPLLEQLEDLDSAATIAEAMLDLRPIRAALGGELEVMIGYSDAGKQIGYFASAVALRRAQVALADVADRRGVTLTIFHGRGGTIGRGGGPAYRSIRAQPPRALRGRLRVTEQGETITTRYGRAEIAIRDLEQMVSAVLLSAVDERNPVPPGELEARDKLFREAAEGARASYSTLLADPDRLARYALAATPIRQVTKLPIGSRPASRRPGLSFKDLRAIPWVFSWNQSRHGLPGWFGLGSGLDVVMREHGLERARELYRESPFFRAIINNAQLALARADIDVARHYALLADADARQIFDSIAAEHERTVSGVLDVVDRQQLLGNAPHLVATIRRRNPYVDVLSHVQIELLRRLAVHESQPAAQETEAERERILSILFITINGIAAGLQTAG